MHEPHTTSLASWSCDLERGLIRGDATLAGWLRLPPAQLTAGIAIEQFLEHVHPEDRTRARALVTDRDAELELELRLGQTEGTSRRTFARASRIAETHLAGALLELTGDEAREPRLMNIRSDRQRSRSLYLETPLPICILEGDELRYTLANPSYRRMVERDVVGVPLLEAFPELAGSRTEARIRSVYRTGEPASVVEERTPLRSLDGTLDEDRFFTVNWEAIRGDTGQIIGVISVGYEVSDQVRARHMIEQARTAAAATYQAKDQFLATLGHELRNPLAPILGALQLMQLRGDEVNERERKVIQRQVEHLIRLVEDLLDISRITRGQLSIEREHIDLAEIVSRAAETSSPLLRQNRHQLVIDVAPGLVIDADPARMTQVVANLLSNAAKYTPVGGRITITGARDRSEVVLSVEDNGVGISSSLIHRVFDVFVQANPTPERSHGLGLGLAIVQSFVVLHGGTVEVHSDGIGRGARFTVRLPRAGEPAVVRAPRSTPRVGRERVLVVDDHHEAADVMARALQLLGYHVQTAYDGPSGLAAARTFAPQVILLDLAMPLMDGYELARQLKADGHPARLIALTGRGSEADRQRSREAGIGDHLVKPIDPTWLASYLSALPAAP